MDLSFQAPGEHHYVHSITGQGICIAGQCYSRSLLLAADQLITDWPPQSFSELSAPFLQPVFQLQPDLVLLGTGSKQHFPDANIMMEFYERGIGVEVMGSAAACRTFNVLVAESRRVVAALFPLDVSKSESDQSMKGISA